MTDAPLVVSLGMLVSPQAAGHPFTYNKSLKEAVESLGWTHWAAVQEINPELPMIHTLPDHWTPCLVGLHYERIVAFPPLQRLLAMQRAIFATADSIVGYITNVVLPVQQHTHRHVVYFVDFFTISHLVPLSLAMSRVSRRNASLWLVYRLDVAYRRTAPLYRWVMRYLQKIMPANSLVTLTDSDLLRFSISRMLRVPVRTLPIPHAVGWDVATLKTPQPIQEARARGRQVGWLPGIARTDKGVDTIRKLTRWVGDSAVAFTLAASASASLQPTPGGCEVIAVPNELSQQDYGSWLSGCDFVILPYVAHEYAERTSGPFVEAVAAGKPPFVTDGTWMAHELRRFDLAEYVVDFNGEDPFLQIHVRLSDAALRRKLARMQIAYVQYHSVANFAAEIRRIYIEMQTRDTR
ncbi:MAG: glycosyltransferase [Caldilineaceae bacterium]|nr:glycosyltransferase [Caldilineaceae bacterium]